MITDKSGANIVSLFYALIKDVQVYDLNNDVVQNAAKRLLYYVNTLLNMYSRIELVRYMDYIFFNKQRLRFEIEGYASLQFMHDKLKTLGIKSLIFLPGIDKDELVIFASVFKEEPDTFQKHFTSGHFNHISIEFSTEEDEIPDFLQNGEHVKRTYFRALKVTKNLLHNLWTNQAVDIKRSRRIVYNLINALSQDELGLMALTTIKDFDEYTYNHSLNVAILSLALGQRLGLSKKTLARLGTAGLLHDIGKVEIPKQLIYKPGKLTDEEWETIKRHSDFGVTEIIKTRGLDEIGLVSITVAYQHHWNYDGSGYPAHEKDQEPTLFSRIVRICDSYDAMTTSRVYQPIPYLPHIVLRVLWKYQNNFYDPALVKAFIQLSGLYPVGSCLELNTGDVCLVIRQNQGHLARPFAKMVLDTKKSKIDGRMVDLSVEKHLKIKKPIYPQQYRIDIAEYFV